MKTVEEYIAKGFDKVTAEYFASGRKKITDAKPLPDYTLELAFDNGEVRSYDCRPLIKPGTVFEKLRDMSVFSRVYLDDTGAPSWDIDPDIDSNKVWSNKIDICPDGCYLDSKPI